MAEEERGVQEAPGEQAVPNLCSKAEDFLEFQARLAIRAYLADFLDAGCLTPTELCWSPRSQARLKNAGPVLRNALDKASTAQAKSAGVSAKTRNAELDAAVDALVRRTWQEDKDKPLPRIDPKGFAAHAGGLPPAALPHEGRRALAEALTECRKWPDKMAALVSMRDACSGSPAEGIVEEALAEALRSRAAMDALLGFSEVLEERCAKLAALWKGALAASGAAGTSAEALRIDAWIASGSIFLRDSVEGMLMKEISGKDRLTRGAYDEEAAAVFRLLRSMIVGKSLIGGPAALERLEKRQARSLAPEAIGDAIRDIKVPSEKALHLLSVAAVALGASNRAVVLKFAEHHFGAEGALSRLIAVGEAPVPQMRTLTAIHAKLSASWFPQESKGPWAASIEAAQADLFKRSKAMEKIEGLQDPFARISALADLAKGGAFVEGRLFDAVRSRIRSHLADASFPASLARAEASAPGAAKSLAESLAAIGASKPG